MKILILWARLADYTVTCFHELASKPNIELYLIYQPLSGEAPYADLNLSFCKETIEYDQLKLREIKNRCIALKPDFIIMASWNYPVYMNISRHCKKNGTYVLSVFDGQWEGTVKQRLGILISSFFLKPCINNFWVPGDRQAIFATKLGYPNPLTGFYCANTYSFTYSKNTFKRKFIFLGRLIEVKGIKNLLSAYKIYRKEVSNPWDLIIVGAGPYTKKCEKQEGITIEGFIQPKDIPQLFKNASCLILPSNKEPWGLVVHEAVLSGLIIIATNKVGSTTWFVRNGLNGLVISPDVQSIVNSLKDISNCSNERLNEMSEISLKLGNLWTVPQWSDYIYKYFLQKEKALKSTLRIEKNTQETHSENLLEII